MPNPILQNLAGPNNLFQRLGQIKQMMSGKDPNAMFDQMMQSNPQFAQFVNANKGKSAEQICQENGIDLNMVKSFFS